MTAHTDPPNPTTGSVSDDEQLPCGRLLSRVWDDWEQQTDAPHRQTCPHCRQAVLDLDELESAVRDLRDETADTAAYDATTLTQRVMDVVRLELRPGRPLSLGEPVEDLWIMEAVAARTLRAAAETVSGVRAGSCRLLPLTLPVTDTDTDTDERPVSDTFAGLVEVRLAIHAPAGVSLPELAEEVRGRVREAADHQLGMAIAAVDVRVTDLIDTIDITGGNADSADSADSQEGRT
ncbi:Asp23/Gls24 family envelope stress response protein [Streptomyces sp. NBC_00414]|uniref:Asp23/Gls24 family envelope stress response protein n=1 Tax=Streptomyces sp. NBC_00414 TaxID=2975739 RepID=UPI002E209109